MEASGSSDVFVRFSDSFAKTALTTGMTQFTGGNVLVDVATELCWSLTFSGPSLCATTFVYGLPRNPTANDLGAINPHQLLLVAILLA